MSEFFQAFTFFRSLRASKEISLKFYIWYRAFIAYLEFCFISSDDEGHRNVGYKREEALLGSGYRFGEFGFFLNSHSMAKRVMLDFQGEIDLRGFFNTENEN